ncbi:MAG: TrmB family transcriptional regulator, partial [Methanothrix sp.]|nr:TrmB family transcriptional regulator [Methanothrix sp.]
MKDGLVDGLRKLGLTEYEAKTYAALVGLGEATARGVHEKSGVPRTRIYDILRDLEGKGFVEFIHGSPT